MRSTRSMHREYFHGSCSGERSLCQGVRRHGFVSPVSPAGQLSQASSVNIAPDKGALSQPGSVLEVNTQVLRARGQDEGESQQAPLPFRKKSSSSWGTLPSACSILMVMLKEKSSLCLSNSPAERWRWRPRFGTEALAHCVLQSKENEVKSQIAK